jgi:hypothetical protein
MTEALATTVAAVAPVVLLVAAVEINNNRQRVRELYESMVRRYDLARELLRDGEPTRQQVEDALRQRREDGARLRAGIGLLFYVLTACLASTLLFLAELRSLAWLAEEPMGSSHSDAEFCVAALALGFAWVGLSPLIPLLAPMYRSYLGMLRGRKDDRRLRQLAREYRSQGANEQATGAMQDG